MSMPLQTGWRRSIWQGESLMSLKEIIPKGGRDFVCAMLPCSVTNQIQGHSEEGQNRPNTRLTAVPFFLSLDFSRKSPRHKQASLQTNKQTGKQTMHAHTSCPYQRPDMTEWARRCCATWETEPRQTGQRAVGAWRGRSYCIQEETTYCCTRKG